MSVGPGSQNRAKKRKNHRNLRTFIVDPLIHVQYLAGLYNNHIRCIDEAIPDVDEPGHVLLEFGVVVAAIMWGLWQAIFTAGVSVLAFDFFFIPPYLSFRLSDSEYLIMFAAFRFVGVVVISFLVVRSKDNATAAQRREDYTSLFTP